MLTIRKFIALILALTVFAGLGGAGLTQAAAVYNPLIAAATPDTAGAVASYHITFNTGQYGNVSELALRFSYDTAYVSDAVMASSVVVNGRQVMSARFSAIANNDIELYVYLNQVLGPATPVTVDIDATAGLVNPTYTRSCYRMRVGLLWNHFEYGELISDLYSIVPSALSNPTLAVEPPIVGSAADYAVSFVTGVNGSLKAGQDNITIAFPAGTSVPGSIAAGLVTVNGIACSGQVFHESSVENALRVYMPVTIAASSPVTVFFPAAFGLRNPAHPGSIHVSVETSREPTRVDSTTVTIQGREVSNLAIGLGTPSAGSATAMQVSFVTSPVGRLQAGQRIYIIPTQAAYAVPPGGEALGLTVNGTSASAIRDGIALSIRMPVSVGDTAVVTIAMPVQFGWVNPLEPGVYDFGVYTESDTSVSHCTAAVVPPSVSSVVLEVNSHGISRLTALTVGCTLSPMGSLAAGDEVRIVFDEGFTIPVSVDPSAVTVNGVAASRVATAGQLLTVVLNGPVVGGSTVRIELAAAAAIRTPAAPGAYGVTVATSRDSVEARSNLIDFRALVNVTFVTSPATPNGSQGYYIGSSPTVSFVADGAKEVDVRIDGANVSVWDGRPLVIPSGKHTVEAWAIDALGTEGDHATQSFLVDLVRPAITVDQGAGDLLVGASPFVVSGTVSEPVDVLKVNGVMAVVGPDLRWTVSIAAGDGQSLSFYAIDIAGNATASVRTVHVDSTPPAIQLVVPVSDSVTTTEDRIVVTFRISETATALVNGVSAAEANGQWSAAVDLVPGQNAVVITARDLAGNESTVRLVIEQRQQTVIQLAVGSARATVDTQTLDMGTQPVLLKSGTVMVPLRFVSEALGATVDWLPAMRIVALKRGDVSIQLQIGSKIALVGLDTMPLLEAPIIVSGRTLVPLRFISEAFGANVLWDQQLKRVTITLAKDSSAR